MKSVPKYVIALCLSGALCLGLTGCYYTPFDVAQDTAHGVQRIISGTFDAARSFFGGWHRTAWDDAADEWEAAWNDAAYEWEAAWDDAADEWNDAGEWAGIWNGPDNPNDHREVFSLAGQGETALRLGVEGASNLILRQGGTEDSYRLEYDPAVFRVDAASADGALSFTIRQLRYPGQSGSDRRGYKCFLTIPARDYESLAIRAAGAGLSVDGLTAAFSLQADDSGFTISDCRGDIALNVSGCGFAAELPRDYAASFRLSGRELGFRLAFPDGEAANLLVRAESLDGFLTKPDEWGAPAERWEYQTGDGSVLVDLAVSDSAGVITVRP